MRWRSSRAAGGRRPHRAPPRSRRSSWCWRCANSLAEQGLDAGADTIGWHLLHRHQVAVSRATIHRILTRHAAVVPDPGKRPRSSYLRFAAEQPNECWQSDFTHYRLTTRAGRSGADAEIITWLDDHARYALSVTAHPRITGPIVVASSAKPSTSTGVPASTLTDNGMVYTTRLSGGKGGRNGPGDRAAPVEYRAEELPTQPPHDLREGGAVPADAEEVAARPTGPAGHDR